MDLLSKINPNTAFYFILIFAVLLYLSYQSVRFFAWINKQKQIIQQNMVWLRKCGLNDATNRSVMKYLFDLNKTNTFKIKKINRDQTAVFDLANGIETSLNLQYCDYAIVIVEPSTLPYIEVHFNDDYLNAQLEGYYFLENAFNMVEPADFLVYGKITLYLTTETDNKLSAPIYQA